MLPTLTSWPDFPKGLKVLLLERTPESKDSTATTTAEPTTDSLLKAASYEVTTCTTASDALQHLKGKHAFHLVLADFSIFAIETGDNLRLLRTLKKSRKTLPFLLLSQSSTPSDVLQAVKLGAAEVIPKPLSPLKAKTLWQHTVRNMMVKSHALDNVSADDSDSISLEQPRTPSVNGCNDPHLACEACSSDSTNDLQDMLSFDLDCAEFNLDQLVGMPESALSLSEQPPALETLDAPLAPSTTPDNTTPPPHSQPSPMSSAAPSPAPACSSSQPLAPAAPSLQHHPMPGSCASFTPPAPTPPSTTPAPTDHHADQSPPTAGPHHPMPQMPQMGVPPIAPPAGGFPMWGMPPMGMMPGMMPGCPPFMMPPFMRPFGPMGMPPMRMGGMPMMPFPMCMPPFGMPPMMCPPPPFAMPGAPMPPADPSAAPQPGCPTGQPQFWGPMQPPCAGQQQQEVACSAPQQAQQQQQQQMLQPAAQQAPAQQQPAQAQAQAQAQAPQEQQQAPGSVSASEALSNWFDSAEMDEPPLGLQLKKSNSLLDLLSQHLFNSAPTCSA